MMKDPVQYAGGRGLILSKDPTRCCQTKNQFRSSEIPSPGSHLLSLRRPPQGRVQASYHHSPGSISHADLPYHLVSTSPGKESTMACCKSYTMHPPSCADLPSRKRHLQTKAPPTHHQRSASSFSGYRKMADVA